MLSELPLSTGHCNMCFKPVTEGKPGVMQCMYVSIDVVRLHAGVCRVGHDVAST